LGTAVAVVRYRGSWVGVIVGVAVGIGVSLGRGDGIGVGGRGDAVGMAFDVHPTKNNTGSKNGIFNDSHNFFIMLSLFQNRFKWILPDLHNCFAPFSFVENSQHTSK
jgi:hypothetical protein